MSCCSHSLRGSGDLLARRDLWLWASRRPGFLTAQPSATISWLLGHFLFWIYFHCSGLDLPEHTLHRQAVHSGLPRPEAGLPLAGPAVSDGGACGALAGSPGGRQHAAPRRMSGGLRWYLQSREDGDGQTVTVPTAVGREDGAGWGALWPPSTPARPRATPHAGGRHVCVSRAPNPDPAARQPRSRSARVPNAALSKLVSPPSPPHASRSHCPVPRGDVPSSSPGQRLQGLADPAPSLTLHSYAAGVLCTASAGRAPYPRAVRGAHPVPHLPTRLVPPCLRSSLVTSLPARAAAPCRRPCPEAQSCWGAGPGLRANTPPPSAGRPAGCTQGITAPLLLLGKMTK